MKNNVFKPEHFSNQHMTIPKHVAIILDGNRRFAKKLMLKPWKGHEWGANKVKKLLEWCGELGIHELTLYTFSVQNFNRPKEEFDYLMNVFKQEFDTMLQPDNLTKLNQNGLRINFIGRLTMFTPDIQEKMNKLMELTKNNNQRHVNFAMAYGGREEVVDAARKISEEVKNGTLNINDINEQTFAQHLYTNSDPDLIIRTGGEKRTSNFLIWQGNYSEWFFLEKTWPEFEKQDLVQCINEYEQRERRFGK